MDIYDMLKKYFDHLWYVIRYNNKRDFPAR